LEIVHQHGLKYYLFPGLASLPGVRHAVFTRQGGLSQGVYASLNVSFGVGDEAAAVAENRRRLAQALKLEALTGARQVHGVAAVEVNAPAADASALAEADILITTRPGLGLLVTTADCQAVFLYDPGRGVAANVHCGWRGQVQDVLGRAVRVLAERFGCRPAELFAAIGPGLGPCCAEFINYRQEFPREFWDYQVRPGFFDLWRLSADQLQAAGVLPSRIECARLCTRCRPEEFYSYRRERRTGRHGAVIALTGT